MKFEINTELTLSAEVEKVVRSQRVFALGSDQEMSITNVDCSLIVMNFILGSWCPMCMNHIIAISKVLLEMEKKNFRILIVTTEKEKSLRDSLQKVAEGGFNSSNLLFIPGASKDLLNSFSLRIPLFGFSKPATFLIEDLKKVKMLSKGIPNKEKVACDLAGYFGTKSLEAA